jgi:hypothetical protein
MKPKQVYSPSLVPINSEVEDDIIPTSFSSGLMTPGFSAAVAALLVIPAHCSGVSCRFTISLEINHMLAIETQIVAQTLCPVDILTGLLELIRSKINERTQRTCITT